MATQLIPGPDHPITIAADGVHVVAKVGGQVVADTKSALTLQESTYPPAYYVPLGDVDPKVLKASDTSTYCPYKGDASYYSVSTPDAEVKDAMWTYAQPYDAVSEIAGYVCFYGDRVELTIDA
jgi:uncharacterized protein (DUF427 family)